VIMAPSARLPADFALKRTGMLNWMVWNAHSMRGPPAVCGSLRIQAMGRFLWMTTASERCDC
jgi:hypothetical protein